MVGLCIVRVHFLWLIREESVCWSYFLVGLGLDGHILSIFICGGARLDM